MLHTTKLDLFAGILVADYGAALKWYERLLAWPLSGLGQPLLTPSPRPDRHLQPAAGPSATSGGRGNRSISPGWCFIPRRGLTSAS